MASITTRAGKGAPLTNAEIDANFTGLNSDGVARQRKHGFELNSAGARKCTVSYDPTTRVVTLTPTASTFDFYIDGVLFTKTGAQTSPAHTAATGRYFVYYDAAGALQVSTSPWSIIDRTVTPVAFVYYYHPAVAGICMTELHGADRWLEGHRNLHFTQGTTRISGLALADYLLNTDTDASLQYSVSSGVIVDEDLPTTVSALPAAGPYTVFYRTGASGDWTWTSTDTFPFKSSATQPQWNEFTGGSWGLTEVSSAGLGTYVNYYLFAVPSVDTATQLVLVPGQATHASLSSAQGESVSNVSWGSIPFEELAPLFKITYHVRSTYTNTKNCEMVGVTEINAGGASVISAVSPSVHNALSSRDAADAHPASAITNTPAGTIAATTVQAALNELDSEKATTGSVSTVAGDLSNHIGDATDAHAASAITNTPAGNIAATTVQAALNELDTEKAPLGGAGTSGTWPISISGSAAQLGGFARRIDLADYSTWDGTKVGPVGWYNIGGGPGGGNYHFGFRTAMADTNYGVEFAVPYISDTVYFRRYGGAWGSWIRLANRDDHALNNTWENWVSFGASGQVAAMLGWKNYGNSHVIFDASNSTSPEGTVISNQNPEQGWAAGYPTLMGWNGTNSYGVRVQVANYAEGGWGGVFAVNTASNSKTIWGVSTAFALNVNGETYSDSFKSIGAACVFARDLTATGPWTSPQSSMQIGTHSTTNGGSMGIGGGPSMLFFGHDNASPPAKEFIGRISGVMESVTAGAISGGIAVNVRANHADGAATTVAATWKANKNLVQEGFTQLGGSGAPAVKMKKLTGTTANTEGGYASVAHGLDGTKIIGFSAIVHYGSGAGMAPGNYFWIGYNFAVHYDTVNFHIANHATDSENILSKSFTILVTYEE